MEYTEQQTIKKVQKELKSVETLYNAKCVNWRGITTDTKEFYTEIIANELLWNLKEFDKINQITRTSSYCRENHSKITIDLNSNRREEIFAKRIAMMEFSELGVIKDYQVPLKDTLKDIGIGKIDLISFNEDIKTLFLIELKCRGNSDTLLRALLESYTYYKIVDKTKLKNDFFSNQENGINPEEISVVPTVLITQGCNAFFELGQMELDEMQRLKALSLALSIKIFSIDFEINHALI